MKDKLLKIVQHYGIEHQQRKLEEEVFELQQAITNCEWASSEYGRCSKSNIIEELADTQVMLKQFQYYYEITDDEIEEIMQFKVDRQLERIEKE